MYLLRICIFGDTSDNSEHMEDYILKEIRKITMLLEALMKKTAGAKDNGYDIIRQEIANQVNLEHDYRVVAWDW